jgi:Flp pilus assembly protein TadG
MEAPSRREESQRSGRRSPGRPAPGIVLVLRRVTRSELGTAVVEMAAILPLFILLVFGVLDFGRAMNYFNDATHMANEGARWAVVNSNPGGSRQTLQDYIKSQGDTSEMQGNSTACIDFPDGVADVGHPVEVKVKTTFNWLPYFGNALGFGTTTMTGRAVMRLEQKPTNYSPDVGC